VRGTEIKLFIINKFLELAAQDDDYIRVITMNIVATTSLFQNLQHRYITKGYNKVAHSLTNLRKLVEHEIFIIEHVSSSLSIMIAMNVFFFFSLILIQF
jgi:hypothetical protein